MARHGSHFRSLIPKPISLNLASRLNGRDKEASDDPASAFFPFKERQRGPEGSVKKHGDSARVREKNPAYFPVFSFSRLPMSEESNAPGAGAAAGTTAREVPRDAPPTEGPAHTRMGRWRW